MEHCNYFLRVAIVLCLALALGIWLSPIDAVVLVPSALLIAMVPISLAGWGVREVVFIQALAWPGLSRARPWRYRCFMGLSD